MKLSIAFITYNRKKELLRAINSCEKELSSCRTEFDYEYLIWDNYSEDGTEEYIKNGIMTSKLRYYRSNVNLGVAGGRNRVFELCLGEYVFFLDDDAVIATNGFFEKLIAYMDYYKDVVAVSPDIQEPDTGTNLNSRNCYKDGEYSTILSFCGCAHILRKNFFMLQNRLYPDNLKFGSEELYASILAHSNHKYVVEYKDIKVEHYPSFINRHQGDERKFSFIYNQYLIKSYLYPKGVLWIVYLCYILHRLKNGYLGEKWDKEAQKLYRDRYQENCINRISYSSWIKIIKRYGFKSAL